MSKHRVGMRSLQQITADPQATAAEIEFLRHAAPQAALQHPNCPMELWWELAGSFPLEAMQSPAGQLFLLEAPDRWAALEKEGARDWVDHYVQRLAPVALHTFALDCAAYALPIFEKEWPRDKRPRKAIAVTRDWLQGKRNYTERLIAEMEASKATYNHKKISTAAYHAAYATNRGASTQLSHILACIRAAVSAYTGSGALVDASVWQWRRLQQYLRGEIAL